MYLLVCESKKSAIFHEKKEQENAHMSSTTAHNGNETWAYLHRHHVVVM